MFAGSFALAWVCHPPLGGDPHGQLFPSNQKIRRPRRAGSSRCVPSTRLLRSTCHALQSALVNGLGAPAGLENWTYWNYWKLIRRIEKMRTESWELKFSIPELWVEKLRIEIFLPGVIYWKFGRGLVLSKSGARIAEAVRICLTTNFNNCSYVLSETKNTYVYVCMYMCMHMYTYMYIYMYMYM